MSGLSWQEVVLYGVIILAAAPVLSMLVAAGIGIMILRMDERREGRAKR